MKDVENDNVFWFTAHGIWPMAVRSHEFEMTSRTEYLRLANLDPDSQIGHPIDGILE